MVNAWEGLFTSPSLRTKLDLLAEGDYLLGKGFTKADLNGFSTYVDNAFSGVKNNLVTRINGENGFSLTHSDTEIQAILLRAKSLNLPTSETDDLLFTSCKVSKQISAQNLMQQMDNWVNTVQVNGYPYLFNSIPEFDQFGTVLKNLANDFDIPIDKFHMQGSSLRKSNLNEIGDFDIAYKVDESTFNNLVTQFTNAASNPTTVSNIISDGQNGVIRSYNMFIDPQTNGSFKGRFYTEFEAVFGNGYQSHFNKPSTFDIQITIVKDGANLDVSPYLKFN